MDYPKPQMRQQTQLIGRTYLVPVALEDYEDGFNRTIVDVYEAAYEKTGQDSYHTFYLFKHRIRQFNHPLHYDINGNHYRCEECEKHWAKWPKGRRPDEVLLTREEMEKER